MRFFLRTLPGESPDGTETKPRLNVAHEGSEIKKEATVPECVMYVRGLQGTTSEEPQIKAALRELFAAAGEVGRIQLPSFREEGKLKVNPSSGWLVDWYMHGLTETCVDFLRTDEVVVEEWVLN